MKMIDYEGWSVRSGAIECITNHTVLSFRLKISIYSRAMEPMDATIKMMAKKKMQFEDAKGNKTLRSDKFSALLNKCTRKPRNL